MAMVSARLACGLLLVAVAGVAAGAAVVPLADCPPTPNCVSSSASDPARRVAVWRVAMPVEQAWPALRNEVAMLPRCSIVAEGADFLRAEVRSRLFGFVDDLELRLDAVRGVVEVRSAARSGKWDFGVNRRRVEGLWARLVVAGVLAPESR